MSQENSTVLNFGEQTKVRLPLAVLLALLSVVAAGSVAWNNLHNADTSSANLIADQTRQLLEHNARLRKLEEGQAVIAVMQNDVGWIRRELEKSQRTSPGRP